LLATLAARAAGAPAVFYTLHGLPWTTRAGWRRQVLVSLDRLACSLATQVFSVSKSVRRRAIQAGLASPGKITVPAHGSADGVDCQRYSPEGVNRAQVEKLRDTYGIPESARVIGFVGRLVPDKGIAELQAAWQRLRERFPSLHLLLIGETEAHDPLPQAVLAGLRSDVRVHCTGWQTDMPQHYALMDVCMLPSRREGLPYAALEAAAMDLPVAAFAVDGVVDAVMDGVTGVLVPAGDAAALGEAVAGLLRDRARARKLGLQARQRVQRLYQPEPLWECVYQHYRQALRAPADATLARRLWWKRPLDLLAAATATILLSPLLALIALAVSIDLGRPVFYRQRRPGLGERSFDILKFRTMREGAGPDRLRMTRLGRWLRRTSLDELPQLINIVRGQMSFIGPRPLLERYLACYTPGERRRHALRPGLTGWAQTHGRNSLSWRERLEMDVWYVDHASWLLDARIAMRTLGWLLSGEGVVEDPSSLMPDLDAERQGA
jgi:lipopolysaccharide/colanic/teichoic acid biosynthesis glycosyltransferase/glycosyltransferase involved in cell wall biosynthesis